MSIHKKKIRLMQITHDLAVGGLQKVVVNICKAIDRDKFHVTVLCLRALGDLVPEIERLGIKVIYLPQKPDGTDYFSFVKVGRVLRSEQTEVIHSHNTQPFIDGTLGSFFSDVKTIVHTEHGRVFPDKKRYMFMERLLAHKVFKVAAVSDEIYRNLVRYEKISPRKLMVIPNGVDGTDYDEEFDEREKKRELGLTGYGPVIGVGARLVKTKGITYLLKAMKGICSSFPNIRLLIMGDGPYKATLQTESREFGVERNVSFLGTRLDVPKILKLCDLYVLPSLSEGMPMGILEAMAAGCPVVATRVGGIPTIIRDGINGKLIEPGSENGLAETIIELLNNDDRRRAFSLTNVSDFKEKFDARIMVRKYETLYERNDVV